MELKVFWGTARAFCGELRTRWQKLPKSALVTQIPDSNRCSIRADDASLISFGRRLGHAPATD